MPNQVTSMSFFKGFGKDIEIITDSNALLSSCIQDNGAMVGTPPIQSLKRKFDDVDIGASPRITSTINQSND